MALDGHIEADLHYKGLRPGHLQDERGHWFNELHENAQEEMRRRLKIIEEDLKGQQEEETSSSRLTNGKLKSFYIFIVKLINEM